MPQTYPTPIDFEVPIAPDSAGNPQHKTVHLVIIEPKKKEDESFAGTILIPFGIVLLIAVAILLFARLIKHGSAPNELLRRLEKLTGGVDRKIAD